MYCLCLPSTGTKGVHYQHPDLAIILAIVDSHESSFQTSAHTQASAGNAFPFLTTSESLVQIQTVPQCTGLLCDYLLLGSAIKVVMTPL